MKEYNNIKELEKDYPDLAIKVKEHFKDKSLNNNEIILFNFIKAGWEKPRVSTLGWISP